MPFLEIPLNTQSTENLPFLCGYPCHQIGHQNCQHLLHPFLLHVLWASLALVGKPRNVFKVNFVTSYLNTLWTISIFYQLSNLSTSHSNLVISVFAYKKLGPCLFNSSRHISNTQDFFSVKRGAETHRKGNGKYMESFATI